MALRLPALGTARAAIVAEYGECRARADLGSDDACSYHGRIAASSDGANQSTVWWHYRFVGDRLTRAAFEISEVDVDHEWAARILVEADAIAAELQRRIGTAPQLDETPLTWAALELGPEGTDAVLRRKVWDDPRLRVAWTVLGRVAHHPVVTIRVVVDDGLRVVPLAPTVTRGAPLLELRGGPFDQPWIAPLWLDLADAANDKCDLSNEALTFPLDDGRVYLAQYNPYCGGHACRVIDPMNGESTTPAECLVGQFMHQRIDAIGGGHYLVASDSEGVGELSIVRWDPLEGTERLFTTSSLGAAGTSVEATVEAAGGAIGDVTFVTPCELPAGCGTRDSNQQPTRTWRWNVARGLQLEDDPR